MLNKFTLQLYNTLINIVSVITNKCIRLSYKLSTMFYQPRKQYVSQTSFSVLYALSCRSITSYQFKNYFFIIKFQLHHLPMTPFSTTGWNQSRSRPRTVITEVFGIKVMNCLKIQVSKENVNFHNPNETFYLQSFILLKFYAIIEYYRSAFR